jgi:hypothetical protein
MRTRNLVIALRAVAGILLASILAGCASGQSAGGQATNGEQNKPAAQVLADAKTAMAQASSFHVSGTANAQGTPESVNLLLSPSRGGGTVTISGATLDLVVSGGFVYIKANATSWQALLSNASESQLLADKWIKSPVSNPNFSDLASFGDVTKLLNGMKPEGSVSKRPGTTSVNGKKAVALVDSTGSVLCIADVGPAYMLSINDTAKSSGGAGTVTFDEFGTAVVPSVPSGAIALPTS